MASLFLDPKIAAAAAGIQVTASGGTVELRGILPGARYVDAVVARCRSLPEVEEVKAEWLGCREERV